MKKRSVPATEAILFCFFLFAFNYSYGQKLPVAQKISYSAPGIINFKQLSEYRLAHPLPPEKPHIADPDGGRDEEETVAYPKVSQGEHVFNFPKIKTGAPEIVSPSAITVFNGTIDNQTTIPPDVGGTVGDSSIVTTTNQEFDILTKTGTRTAKLDIGTFFSAAGLPSGGGFSDPHAAYDAVYHKFIVVILYFLAGNNSYIAIAVSKTSDPSGDWYSYHFKPFTNNTTLFDYPQIGINNKWVVVTGNGFPSGGGEKAQVVVLNRADLYSGVAGTASSFAEGSNTVSISPAITTDTSVTTEYLVADYSGIIGSVKLFTITGPVNSPVYASGQTLAVSQHWSETVVNAKQLGTTKTILVNDTRIIDAVYTKGSLWFSHAVYLPSSKPVNTGADWWQVNPVTSTVVQFGRIYDTTGNIFYYYPSIAVDTFGNALVGYTLSSPTMYASTGYSYHASGDAPNTMEDNFTYKNGTAAYFKDFGSGRNRWGDFSISSLDPANGNFWTIEEYATTPASSWATSLAEVGNVACSGKPDASFIVAPDTVCNGNTAVLNLNNPITSSGIRYQWQQSPNGATGWIDAAGTGATTSVFTTAALTTPTYFRCAVNCINSGLSDTSASKLVNISTVVVNVTGSANAVCKGSPDTLTATGGKTFSWAPGGASGSTIIVKPTATTTYVATGTNNLGCKGTASFTVNVSKVSVATSRDTLCQPTDSAILTASGAATYVWHPGNETGGTIVVKPAITTVYTAVGTDSIGCIDSASITEHVGNCATGVTIIGKTTGIQIFPAPAKNFFTLEITGLAGKNCDLIILNILGNKVLTSSLKVNSDAFHQVIDISKFTSGIYFVKVMVGNKEWNVRIIKQ